MTENRQTQLKVKLLTHTPNPLEVIHTACRQCYCDEWAGDDPLYIKAIQEHETFKKKINLIRRIISSGHTSVLEHVSFTFAVAGISRALSHQAVRHRVGLVFSQQSQRYVAANDFPYVIPPHIQKHEHINKRFAEIMDYLGAGYEEIRQMLITEGYEKTANEDARFVLPNACETKFVVTLNARALLNFLSLRCCERAQWEIRQLARMMLREVSAIVPVVFEQAGAPCEHLGYCPEDPKFSCGKYPISFEQFSEIIKTLFHRYPTNRN